MTPDEIIDRVRGAIRHLGFPSQPPYSDAYVDLFMEAYFGDGPTPDQLLDVLSQEELTDDARRNLEDVWENWTAWKVFMRSVMPRRLLIVPDPRPLPFTR